MHVFEIAPRRIERMKETPANNMALLWVLNLADGAHSLLDMAERANMPFQVIADAARRLQTKGLLEGLGMAPMQPRASRHHDQRAKGGQALSRPEISVGVKGQPIAKAGSSKRTPQAAAGS